jgi:hypothetical protein
MFLENVIPIYFDFFPKENPIVGQENQIEASFIKGKLDAKKLGDDIRLKVSSIQRQINLARKKNESINLSPRLSPIPETTNTSFRQLPQLGMEHQSIPNIQQSSKTITEIPEKIEKIQTSIKLYYNIELISNEVLRKNFRDFVDNYFLNARPYKPTENLYAELIPFDYQDSINKR